MNLGDVNPNDFIVRDNNNVPRWRSPDSYSSIKSKLNRIVRHPHNVPIIVGYANTMHKIKDHTCKFLKLLFLHRFESNLRENINVRITLSLPLNKALIVNIAKTICEPTNIGQGRTSDATIALRGMLLDFYDNQYAETIQAAEVRPSYKNLYTPIDYMAEDVLTMYENNIKMNFKKYLVLYVNCYRNKNNVFEGIDNNLMLSSAQKQAQKSQFYRFTNAIVFDILRTNRDPDGLYAYTSGFDRMELDMMKQNALPNKQVDNIMYDLKVNPFDYFHGMIVMMRFLHDRGYKVPNLFPQITTRIPGHFKMDTSTMIDMLYPLQNDEFWGDDLYRQYVYLRTGNKTKAQASANGYMKNNKDRLWRIFFKTEDKGLFHGHTVHDNPRNVPPFVDQHNTTFHHMIQTNGVAASIICVKKTLAEKFKPKNPKYDYVEPYIHEITPAERDVLQTMPNFAAIDPNRRDLLSCVLIDKNQYNNAENNNDDVVKVQVMKAKRRWRETADNRRNKMKINRNRKRLQKDKKNTLDNYGISIQKREAELSRFNKKTLTFESFQQYCYHKNKFNHVAGPFYEQKKHRNRQFRAFGVRQKLDADMINSFKKTIGPPATTVVFMGDWCEKKHRRFNEPVKGKGFRQVFRKAGYLVYLVDEFKTSKMCSECQADVAICENFRTVRNPKPRTRLRFPTVLCHGLVKCTNCRRLWNRDPNAASNIWVAANAAVNGIARPQYLQRNPNEMDIDDN